MIVRIIGSIIGTLLAVLVLSYVAGDNPLYRLALHIFVGVLIGYSVGFVVREVLVGMALPQLQSHSWSILVPLVLGILLLFKGFPRQAFVGNASIAYLVGVGTAVALGGALLGTIVPQVTATTLTLSPAALAPVDFGLLDGLMVVLGTVCTLLAFSFTESGQSSDSFTWRRLVAGAAWIGRVFLVLVFGLAFAGAVTTSLSIFAGRMQYFINLALPGLGL